IEPILGQLEHARFIDRISSPVSKLQGQYGVSSAFEFFSDHWASTALPNARQLSETRLRGDAFPETWKKTIGGPGRAYTILWIGPPMRSLLANERRGGSDGEDATA